MQYSVLFTMAPRISTGILLTVMFMSRAARRVPRSVGLASLPDTERFDKVAVMPIPFSETRFT